MQPIHQITRKNDKLAARLIRASTKTRSKLQWISKDYSKILMDRNMNQFPKENPQARPVNNTQSPDTSAQPGVSRGADPNCESIEVSIEQAESNVNRFAKNESISPASSQVNNFDVQDYARLSSEPPTDSGSKTPDAADIRIGRQFGEIDPYVNPAEFKENDKRKRNKQSNDIHLADTRPEAQTSCGDGFNTLAGSAHQILEPFDASSQQLELLDHEGVPRLQSLPLHPTFEIVSTNQNVAVENMRETVVSESAGELNEGQISVAWFAATATPETSNRTVLPVVTKDTGELVFDVRDFGNSVQGVIEPIPGSFEVEPDLFDFQTIDEIDSSKFSSEVDSASPQTDAPAGIPTDPLTDNQIFVEGNGDMIHVNGSDGFDHIDLACFDVKLATFSDHAIQIDDQQGTFFEIRYQDISYALFADGMEVRLDTNDFG